VWMDDGLLRTNGNDKVKRSAALEILGRSLGAPDRDNAVERRLINAGRLVRSMKKDFEFGEEAKGSIVSDSNWSVMI